MGWMWGDEIPGNKLIINYQYPYIIIKKKEGEIMKTTQIKIKNLESFFLEDVLDSVKERKRLKKKLKKNGGQKHE